MKVNEVFTSIQGEGPLAGVPMVFLRLGGCNLSCVYCDTRRTEQDFEEINIPSVRDIITNYSFNSGYKINWLCITGGEPLMQEKDLGILLLQLRDYKIDTIIETNGSIFPPDWRFASSWAIDVKCPSSGNKSDINILSRWLPLGPDDYFKFVVNDDTDIFFAEEIISKFDAYLNVPKSRIVLSPVFDGSDGNHLARDWALSVSNYCVCNNYRFSLQLHKIIGCA